jgi:glycosyltransferase involved in cell wall biosynthesis
MKIAFVTSTAAWQQNQQACLFNTIQARELTALGHPTEVFVAGLGGPTIAEKALKPLKNFNTRPEEYVWDSVKVHAVKRIFPPPHMIWKYWSRLPHAVARAHSLVYTAPLAERIDRFRPDFILAHGGLVHGLNVARLAGRYGVPFGFIEQDPIEHDPSSAIGKFYSRKLGASKVSFHVGYKWVRYMRDHLGIKQTRVAPNGAVFPTAAQRAMPRPEKWAGMKVLLMVGNMREGRKGHALAISAVGALKRRGMAKNLKFLIVGNPPPELTAAVAAQDVADIVEFIPPMPVQQIQQYMVWADLFVMPSWQEACALVYFEAMGGETPVIMTWDCGVAALIRDRVHGWVIQPQSQPALEEAIIEAITKADLPAMGRAGRQLVEARFTWRDTARAIIAGIQGAPSPIPEPDLPPAWLAINGGRC